MKSRRQFVREGALAATALFVTQHVKAFATFSSPLAEIDSADKNHLVVLHSIEQKFSFADGLVSNFTSEQKKIPNAILIHSGAIPSPDLPTPSLEKEKYNIITKGNLTTGIVYAKPGELEVLAKTEKLAAYLKNEKKCTLVVCVSHLGHKQENSIDDITLASQSENIDIIINGHETNFLPKTLVLPNLQKNEVIIQSSKDNLASFAKLEIGFDSFGAKKYIHYATKLYKDVEAA